MSVLFGRVESRSSAEWFAIGESAPGTMTETRATGLTAVFAAIRFFYDYASTTPVDFYRKDGKKRVEVEPPELVRNVEAHTPFGVWLGQAMYSDVVHGNAVGRIMQLGRDLKPLDVRWAETWSYGTDWWVDGKPLPDSLVAHIPWIVPPGKRLGLSPIEHYAATVQAGLSAQEYANVKRGGGLPPTLLKNTKKELTPEFAQAAQERAARSFATGKPWVAGVDWDLTIVTIPPNQKQFIETLGLTANQIASVYGIDPREVGGTPAEGSVTYVNDEARALNRAQDAAPSLTRLENAVSAWLPDGIYMKFNLDARVRADIKTRTEVIGAKVADGRLSVNEARALEDLEGVPGGDFHNVPRSNEPVPTSR